MRPLCASQGGDFLAKREIPHPLASTLSLPELGRREGLRQWEDDIVDAGQHHHENPAGQPQKVLVAIQ